MFITDGGAILPIIGLLIFIIGVAFEEKLCNQMNKSEILLKKYIDFSKKSEKCIDLGFHVGGIAGKVIIGLFVTTGFMARIPLEIMLEINFGSHSYNSQNIYEEVYKYDTDEEIAYNYNWIAVIFSIFVLYIYTKLFMNVISCTITGAYDRLNLNECIEDDKLNQCDTQNEESLINYYFDKSFTVCIGSIFAQPICYALVIIFSFFKFFVKLAFEFPIYFMIIAIIFYPVIIAAMLMIDGSSKIIIIILLILFLLTLTNSNILKHLNLSFCRVNIKYVNMN